MNILLIGSGGREHAIARALSMSGTLVNLFCHPGNPGIFKFAKPVAGNFKNHKDITGYCRKSAIDLVVIGPEQPLAEGLADELRENGINVFGPSKGAAKLESSKNFAKEFMIKYSIPTAKYKTFTSHETKQAHAYIDNLPLPIVLKADGLAAGKGVIIAERHSEAHDTLDSMFEGLFGDAGAKVVIEEHLDGEEVSILAITDGKDYITLATSQDHKRVNDFDEGKNTGGMGAYSPAPFIDDELTRKIHERIITRTIKGMNNEGTPFIGCLYAGLMISGGEPKVIEFNVRFGDPETQAVLSVFRGDFARLLYSASIGKLDKSALINAAEGFAACVILASSGYPDSYRKGFEIKGIEKAESTGAIVYQAGTELQSGKLLTSGGRVLGVTGIGSTLDQSINDAYNAVNMIEFENCHFRTDIGKKGLLRIVGN